MEDLGIASDALVLLVGPSGGGKSTWAAARFPARAVLSSDAFRELVAGDAADQGASGDAFRILHAVARSRLRRGLLTVIDATNLTPAARRPLVREGRRFGRQCVAVVFDPPVDEALARNARRPGRLVPEDVVRWHASLMPSARDALAVEGYDRVIIADG
jgi:predicted kinase